LSNPYLERIKREAVQRQQIVKEISEKKNQTPPKSSPKPSPGPQPIIKTPSSQPKTNTKSVPVNKGVIKHIENVKTQVETRKNIAEKIISNQPVNKKPSQDSKPKPSHMIPITTDIKLKPEPPEPKPVTYTPQQYLQEITEQHQQAKKQLEQFEQTPTPKYTPGYVSPIEQILNIERNIYIKELQRYEAQTERNKTRVADQVREWHPDTKIVKTSSGYNVKFPYSGAERYGYYKNLLDPNEQKDFGSHAKSFGLNLAASLSAEDPLGVTSSYYRATGDNQKAIDTKIKAIHSTKYKPFHEHYFSMPTTQIGLAAAGGAGVGAATKAGYLTSSAARIGLVSVGAVGVGSSAYSIGGDVVKGRHGEALGKGVTLGFSFAAGYAGYKYGQSVKAVPTRVSNFAKNVKFKYAKKTGKGLYKESELTDVYDGGGQWQEVSNTGESIKPQSYDSSISFKDASGVYSQKLGSPRYSKLTKTTGWSKTHEGYLTRAAYDKHVTKTTGWKDVFSSRRGGLLESDIPKTSSNIKGRFLYDYKTGMSNRLETVPAKVSNVKFFKPSKTVEPVKVTSSSSPVQTVAKPVSSTPLISRSYSPPTYNTGYPTLGVSYGASHGGYASAMGFTSLNQLNRMEEGIVQTSGRWNNVKPSSKVGSVPVFGSNVNTASAVKTNIYTDVKPIFKTLSRYDTSTTQSYLQDTSQSYSQDVVQTQIQRQISKNQQSYKTSQTYVSKTVPKTIPVVTTKSYNFKTTKPNIIPFLKFDDNVKKQRKKTFMKGYKVGFRSTSWKPFKWKFLEA